MIGHVLATALALTPATSGAVRVQDGGLARTWPETDIDRIGIDLGEVRSGGPAAGAWPLSLGAFHAFVPQIMDSGDEPRVVAVSYVWVMTLAELVLPPMVAAGLLARWSAAFLIGQMGLATRPGQAGALFDASPYDAVPDQLLLWTALILPVVLFGARPLSLDAGLARVRRSRSVL